MEHPHWEFVFFCKFHGFPLLPMLPVLRLMLQPREHRPLLLGELLAPGRRRLGLFILCSLPHWLLPWHTLVRYALANTSSSEQDKQPRCTAVSASSHRVSSRPVAGTHLAANTFGEIGKFGSFTQYCHHYLAILDTG